MADMYWLDVGNGSDAKTSAGDYALSTSGLL